MTASSSTARLLITCPDRPGIVSTVTTLLYNHGANITSLDQHSTDPSGGTFFMRLEFHAPHLAAGRDALEQAFGEVVARRFDMQWRISYASEPKRMVVLVSKFEHALMELLWRWRRGELPALITGVISNHQDWQKSVEDFEIPFHHVPVSRDTKAAAEQQILELLGDHTDLVVLARYMQIVSGDFVARFPDRIINIHHSFLPAFVGANPYTRAYERGVKLIGATAHYVTAELDAGPIIDQDVIRVSHRHSVDDLRQLGQNIERDVLARAVRWHLEDRVLVHGNKTIVFA
jgi:formyltetrahydrofolate deformylase